VRKIESFEDAVGIVLEKEGGYVDDPADSGGKTKYGITETTARQFGYTKEMKDLELKTALNIYKIMYWDPICGDEMIDIAPHTVMEIFDTGVNVGVSKASKFLQATLNAFLGESQKLIIDGLVGRRTMSALRAYLKERDELVFVTALNCLQGAHYLDLASRRPKDKKFLYGWIKNRVVIQDF
jgi:lysozyme family protein